LLPLTILNALIEARCRAIAVTRATPAVPLVRPSRDVAPSRGDGLVIVCDVFL
jgi:hypothetical protein